jgi:predicted dehydrogenase
MDYTKTTLKFKILKSIRYLKMYGIGRTFIKVRSQFHIKTDKNFSENTSSWENKSIKKIAKNKSIGIIGCGNFSFSNIAYYLKKENPNFLLCTYDINLDRSISLCQYYNGRIAYNNISDFVSDEQLKLVYIASNHSTHANYAIDCINAGKDVHIEKPTVVSYAQLEQLIEVIKSNPKVKIFQGFNRPKSKLFLQLKSYLNKQGGPLMINWFVAGHEIPDDHWYFDESEGGRILGNLCHWTDLTLELIGHSNAFPCKIKNSSPPKSKSDFVISIEFADMSCAAITFSAKGHTFEGVKEILNIHRGNLLATLKDFQTLHLDIVDKKIIKKSFFRDHGHRDNIINSYMSSLDNNGHGVSLSYLVASSLLALKVKESVDSGRDILIDKEDIENYLSDALL